MNRPPPFVTVTIDTEEDDWGSYAPHGATVENIPLLADVHELFTRFGARPTFFVNRPPLVDDGATAVLRDLLTDGSGEAATHCHPWNTPPLAEGGAGESMMCRLPAGVNLAKISEVTKLVEDRLGRSPTSFRAGRWGFGPTVAPALSRLGYRVDSSVSPLIDWSPIGGPDYSGAELHPYRFRPEDPWTPAADGALLEIPTTVGFLRGDPRLRGRLRSRLERSALRHFKVVGVLDRLGVLARRWLSPETSRADELIALAGELVGRGWEHLDLTFHSSTLLPGATPFVTSESQRRDFLVRIEAFLEFAFGQGMRFVTMSECADLLIDSAPDPDRP